MIFIYSKLDLLTVTNKSMHGRETKHGQYNSYAQRFDTSPKREGLLASVAYGCGTVCLMILKGKTVFHLLRML